MIGSSVRHIALYAALFAGGFAGTYAARMPGPPPEGPGHRGPLVRWLGLDPATAEKVRELDPSFGADLQALRKAHDDERGKLAELFEKPDVTDAELRNQFEAVIAAGNAVERRVADHLLAVRDHLTPAQQRQLFDLCAEHVRQGRRHRWRGGPPPDGTDERSAPGRGRRHRGGGG